MVETSRLPRPTFDRSLAIHVLAIVAIVVLVPVALTAVPSLFGADRARVAGQDASGMQPTLKSHHVVFVEQVPASTVGRDDVIRYRAGGEDRYTRVALVTSVDGERAFITKQDAQPRPRSEPVRASTVEGRMVISMPYVGAVVGTARSTPVLKTLVLKRQGVAIYELLAWALLIGIVFFETRTLLARVERSLVDSAGGGLALTREDLTATTLALGILAGFATGVFLSAPSPLTLTLDIMAIGLFGYAGILWWTTPADPPGETMSVVAGSYERTADGNAEVAVDSPETLAGMAIAAEQPLAVDGGTDSCFLPHRDVVYVSEGLPRAVTANGASATDEPTASQESAARETPETATTETPVKSTETVQTADAATDQETVESTGGTQTIDADSSTSTDLSGHTKASDIDEIITTLREKVLGRLELDKGTIEGVAVATVAIIALVVTRILVGSFIGDPLQSITMVGVIGGLLGGGGMAMYRTWMGLDPVGPAATTLNRLPDSVIREHFGGTEVIEEEIRLPVSLYVLFTGLVGALFPQIAWLLVGSGTTALAGVAVAVGLGTLVGIAGVLADDLDIIDLEAESAESWVFLGSYVIYGVVLGTTVVAIYGLVG